MDTSKAFEIKPAPEGGFVISGSFELGEGMPLIAAFSNAADMIAWIVKQYGGNKNLCEDEGCDHHGMPHVCINGRTSPDSDMKRAAYDGSPATDGWIEHDGRASMPKSERGKPCMARRRDGTQYATSTFHNADDWDWRWEGGGKRLGSDIVAYRLIPAEMPVSPTSDEFWIMHDGLTRPMDADTFVKVKFRDGEISGKVLAGAWTWEHRPDIVAGARDIVAYRFA